MATILLICSLTACSPSIEDITQTVRSSMEQEFKANLQYHSFGLRINDLTVTHVRDNEYRGILKVTEQGLPKTYSVDIIYDGKTVQWQIRG